MGKNNYIKFQSDTKLYEEDCHIKNSNLYIFQFTKGTNRDWRKEYADYIIAKATGQDLPNIDTKNIVEAFWGVFYKPEDMDYKEFCDKVNAGEIAMAGHTPIIPTGNDYTQVDRNGNLLVKTITSKLEDYTNCGNMLIDGKTGEVLREPQPSTIINALPENSNFYPIEIYQTTIDKNTGNKVTIGKSYNFLDPNGKIVNSERNFELSQDGYGVYKFPRNYYDRERGKVINDWTIYPPAYVVVEGRHINFYESPIEIIEENRNRIKNYTEPLVLDEEPYVKELKNRKETLDGITEFYGKRFDNKDITDNMYDKILDILNSEYDKLDKFEEQYGELITDNEQTFDN